MPARPRYLWELFLKTTGEEVSHLQGSLHRQGYCTGEGSGYSVSTGKTVDMMLYCNQQMSTPSKYKLIDEVLLMFDQSNPVHLLACFNKLTGPSDKYNVTNVI